MPSTIFINATRYVMPLLLLFSIFILFRGHNEPGGGFIGALAASSAFAMHMLAFNVEKTRALLHIDPIQLIAGGLLIAFTAGVMGLFAGQAFMTGLWLEIYFPVIGKPGTPLFFDIGVYLVVIGITMLILFSLADDKEV